MTDKKAQTAAAAPLVGDLKAACPVLAIVDKFSKSLNAVEQDLEKALKTRLDPSITIDEKIQLDSYLAYLNSSLYLMLLKVQGADETKHAITNDLEHINVMMEPEKTAAKNAIANSKQKKQEKIKTKIFIRSGCQSLGKNNTESNQ